MWMAGELQPQIDINKAVSRLFVCLFVSLVLWWDNDRTRIGCWRTNWNCIAFAIGIYWFCFVFVFVFCLLVFSPLVRQWQNFIVDTNTRTWGWRTNSKIIKTENLLHLNLGIFFLFFSVLLSLLCLCNACLVHHWLVHYLSLFISLALLFVCVCVCVCVCVLVFFSLFLYLLCFPSPLTIPV
jgi:hypothetical protein